MTTATAKRAAVLFHAFADTLIELMRILLA